jgi:hypothetical protein
MGPEGSESHTYESEKGCKKEPDLNHVDSHCSNSFVLGRTDDRS